LAFSNKASDIDNPIKLISDILQKRYGINDKDIYELVVKKVIVAKGREYFEFNIESL
jgi:Holliday junction resolvase RusA-like endonuclease